MVDAFITISDRRIGYTDVGQGPPVLLLHGDTWDRRSLATVIEDLSTDHRVIAPDTRGHGKSPDTRGPFSYEDFADDWRMLIDRLDLGQVAVVGHSGGACTALLMGLTYPELLRGMVLVCCPYHVSNYRDGLLETFENADFERHMSEGWWAESSAAEYGDVGEYRRFWTRMVHELFTRQPNLTPRELKRIPTRSLVMHAENEEGFDVRHSRDLVAMLPDAELVVVPGAGHGDVFSHDPAFVNTRIRGFLDALAPGEPA